MRLRGRRSRPRWWGDYAAEVGARTRLVFEDVPGGPATWLVDVLATPRQHVYSDRLGDEQVIED